MCRPSLSTIDERQSVGLAQAEGESPRGRCRTRTSARRPSSTETFVIGLGSSFRPLGDDERRRPWLRAARTAGPSRESRSTVTPASVRCEDRRLGRRATARARSRFRSTTRPSVTSPATSVTTIMSGSSAAGRAASPRSPRAWSRARCAACRSGKWIVMRLVISMPGIEPSSSQPSRAGRRCRGSGG